MACSKLEAMAIHVVNQACGNEITPAVYQSPFILRRQVRESRFFQNCGTFNTNQNKKYHNFERIEIRATVFLK